MKIPKPALAGLLIVFCVIAVRVIRDSYVESLNGPAEPRVASSPREKGNPAALIRIVEYTDFQCPACAKASMALHETMEKYPDNIHLELKYFPLKMHTFARRASVYAECASEQGKFWPFHDVIFKSQESWSNLPAVDEYFSQLAVSMGIDGVRLSACVNSGVVEAKIDQDVEEAEKLGLTSTPTFFVNGKMLVGGKKLGEELDSLLEKK